MLQVQKRRKQATAYRQKELGYNPKDTRLLLTTEDLSEALKEVRAAISQLLVCRVVWRVTGIEDRIRKECLSGI